ncbi:MAG: hypothetical protein NZO58_14595, partial [Gemmataceae bacterium]|nr:hypothetical protein [Gemmataceae bacterium]
SEAYKLKENRQIANDFLRGAAKQVVKYLDQQLKPEAFKKAEDNPKEFEQLSQLARLRTGLEIVARRPRFFEEMGFKIDDIVDFKLWLLEADQLGIELTDIDVRELTAMEVGGARLIQESGAFQAGMNEVYHQHHSKIHEGHVWQALRDEFRVRLAQSALGYAPSVSIGRLFSNNRLALSPGQMWEYYKEKRIEYKISLVPLYVEDFLHKVGEPNDVDLNVLFEKNKAVQYDPASDVIGFALPARVKAAFVTADPDSKFYKTAANVAILMQSAPLSGSPWPGMQVVIGQLDLRWRAEQIYQSIGNKSRFYTGSWYAGELDDSLAAWMTQNDPGSVAALVGIGAIRGEAGFIAGAAAYRSTLALGSQRSEKAKQLFHEGLRDKARERAPYFATLVLLGSTHQGMALPEALERLKLKLDHVPIGMVQDEMVDYLKRSQARLWVHDHMKLLRKKLEEPNVNTRLAIERVLLNYGAGFDLQRGETKEAYSKFTIGNAKELEPLRKAFEKHLHVVNNIEARVEPGRRLTAGDFWRLFFDSSESFAAAGNRYQVRSWPPTVRVESQLVQRMRMIPDWKKIPDPESRQIAI